MLKARENMVEAMHARCVHLRSVDLSTAVAPPDININIEVHQVLPCNLLYRDTDVGRLADSNLHTPHTSNVPSLTRKCPAIRLRVDTSCLVVHKHLISSIRDALLPSRVVFCLHIPKPSAKPSIRFSNAVRDETASKL